MRRNLVQPRNASTNIINSNKVFVRSTASASIIQIVLDKSMGDATVDMDDTL